MSEVRVWPNENDVATPVKSKTPSHHVWFISLRLTIELHVQYAELASGQHCFHFATRSVANRSTNLWKNVNFGFYEWILFFCLFRGQTPLSSNWIGWGNFTSKCALSLTFSSGTSRCLFFRVVKVALVNMSPSKIVFCKIFHHQKSNKKEKTVRFIFVKTEMSMSWLK